MGKAIENTKSITGEEIIRVKDEAFLSHYNFSNKVIPGNSRKFPEIPGRAPAALQKKFPEIPGNSRPRVLARNLRVIPATL